MASKQFSKQQPKQAVSKSKAKQTKGAKPAKAPKQMAKSPAAKSVVAKTNSKQKALEKKKPAPKKVAVTKVNLKAAEKVTEKTAKKVPANVAKAPAKPLAKSQTKLQLKQQQLKQPAKQPLKKPAKEEVKPAVAVTNKKGNGKSGPGLSTAASRRAEMEARQKELLCREVSCENVATTGRYCRSCYIKNWKKIKKKELILREKKLDVYIEELVSKYPDRYLEAIRQDLVSDKDFAKVISDLEIDEFGGAEEFDPEAESAVEEVVDSSIKRAEIDDEDEFGGGF